MLLSELPELMPLERVVAPELEEPDEDAVNSPSETRPSLSVSSVVNWLLVLPEPDDCPLIEPLLPLVEPEPLMPVEPELEPVLEGEYEPEDEPELPEDGSYEEPEEPDEPDDPEEPEPEEPEPDCENAGTARSARTPVAKREVTLRVCFMIILFSFG